MAAGGGLPLEERRTRRARMRRMPELAWAQQAPGGTSTPGINLHIKDHDRMGRGPRRWRRRSESWLVGASTRRGMACRNRQWARTRMRPCYTLFEHGQGLAGTVAHSICNRGIRHV